MQHRAAGVAGVRVAAGIQEQRGQFVVGIDDGQTQRTRVAVTGRIHIGAGRQQGLNRARVSLAHRKQQR